MTEVIRDKRGSRMAESSSSQGKSSSASGVLGLTAQIVAAHVGNNKVPAEELPGLIKQVFLALSGPGGSSSPGIRDAAPA